MKGRKRPQLVRPRENTCRALFGKPPLHLSEQPVAADGVQHGQIAHEQAFGVVLQPEAQSLLVADCTQDAGGVVGKAAVVERPHESAFQVANAVERVQGQPLRFHMQGNGYSVDGEIPPGQVLLNCAVGNLREGAGPAVTLGPGGHQVQGHAVHLNLGRGELGAGHHLSGETLGDDGCHSLRVANHNQVKVFDGPAQKHVTHASAHQVNGHALIPGDTARRLQKFQLPRRKAGLQQFHEIH